MDLNRDVQQFLYYMDRISNSTENKLKGDITNGYSYEDDTSKPLRIRKVKFNDPATIVIWNDGTKTVVKVQEGDTFDPEKGLAMAIVKKVTGNRSNFNNLFKTWIK